MSKEKIERRIGFIQGVSYAATLINKHGVDAYNLIEQSGISTNEIRKYTEEIDLEYLEETLNSIDR